MPSAEFRGWSATRIHAGFSWRIAGLVCICATAIGFLGVLASRSLATLNEGTDVAATTQHGIYDLAQVLQILVEMGGGVRHFETTHDPDSFLDAQQAGKQLPGEIATLRQLLSDDATQRALLTQLVELTRQRQSQTQLLMERAQAGDFAGVHALAVKGDGARIMEACRTLVTKMQNRQAQLWQRRVETAKGARDRVAWAITAIAALATVLLVLVAFIAMRHAERLRRAQEELATTLRSIGDAVIATDIYGRVRFMNPVAEKLTGWDTEQARGEPLALVFKTINEHTREVVEHPVARVLREKVVVDLANHTLLVGRGGQEYPIEDSAAPIYGADGVIVGVVLVFRDATTQRAAQRELLDSQAKLQDANAHLEERIAQRTAQLLARDVLIRTLYEHSSECHAILVETNNGQFRYEEINPATLKLYGKTRAEVIGHTVDELFDPGAAAILNAHMAAAIQSPGPYRYERKEGDRFIEAIAAGVPQEAGVGRRLVVSARDMTERRRLEQQLLQSQKMEAVGQLTGGLAHDFNNLLTAISGSLELIQTRVAAGRFSDIDSYVAAAQGAAKRAAALTHRLLAFSRRQTLNAKPTDVNRLVEDMVDLIQRTVGPEIKIEVFPSTDLWTPSVDANQLENALLNLCINARDAMPGGGEISIETANHRLDERTGQQRDLPPGQYISLCVSDTGCGMSAEIIARAFEPFFTTKPLGQGTGLGLSMIYGYARQSGGQVRIHSEVGHGSTICIYLPRFLGEAVPAGVLSPAPQALLASGGQTVLVVDDEAAIRMLISDVLTDMGYLPIECSDGVEALELLKTDQRVDLMVTDVGLPNGINGRQLADAGRVLRPDMKVLFITGYAEHSVFSRGQIVQGLEILSKPFDIDTLASRISGMMHRPAV